MNSSSDFLSEPDWSLSNLGTHREPAWSSVSGSPLTALLSLSPALVLSNAGSEAHQSVGGSRPTHLTPPSPPAGGRVVGLTISTSCNSELSWSVFAKCCKPRWKKNNDIKCLSTISCSASTRPQHHCAESKPQIWSLSAGPTALMCFRPLNRVHMCM